MLLAERLDRRWARHGEADDRHAMARRQIARGVADAIGREAEGERAINLTAALAERLEALDTEARVGRRSAEAIIAEICRDLGLDPVRMTINSPIDDTVIVAEADESAPLTRHRAGREARPPPRRPTG